MVQKWSQKGTIPSGSWERIGLELPPQLQEKAGQVLRGGRGAWPRLPGRKTRGCRDVLPLAAPPSPRLLPAAPSCQEDPEMRRGDFREAPAVGPWQVGRMGRREAQEDGRLGARSRTTGNCSLEPAGSPPREKRKGSQALGEGSPLQGPETGGGEGGGESGLDRREEEGGPRPAIQGTVPMFRSPREAGLWLRHSPLPFPERWRPAPPLESVLQRQRPGKELRHPHQDLTPTPSPGRGSAARPPSPHQSLSLCRARCTRPPGLSCTQREFKQKWPSGEAGGEKAKDQDREK